MGRSCGKLHLILLLSKMASFTIEILRGPISDSWSQRDKARTRLLTLPALQVQGSHGARALVYAVRSSDAEARQQNRGVTWHLWVFLTNDLQKSLLPRPLSLEGRHIGCCRPRVPFVLSHEGVVPPQRPVSFINLTSHGGRDGALSALRLWRSSVGPFTVQKERCQ